MRNTLFILCSIILILGSCSDFQDVNNIDREEQEVTLAIPLVNTSFSVSDFTSEESDNNVAIKVDSEDRVTLVYQGDVVRQDVTAVFPAVPFFAFPLLDTLFSVPVPFASDQQVDRAIFGDTKMIFGFDSQFEEDVNVHVTIPQLTLNGKEYENDFLISFDGTNPVKFKSDSLSIKGWTLASADNTITINYDARLANGERVTFEGAAMIFDNIVFDYVEGYFGSEVFDINGDFVPIGVLDTWVSGGLSFEDPKVNIFVENAFGFPVRSIFNKMQVETTTGQSLDMESEIIDNNVDFAYPSLTELGEVKITEFSFNKDNSNIVDLFKERVVRVTYDIDAGANPDMDDSIIGFVNEDSYFLVSVDVELPLQGTVNNLVLQDTVDLDLSDLEDGDEAEFKSVIKNNFPADISMQAYFYSETDDLLDSLFQTRLFLPGAPVDGTGLALDGSEVINFESFDQARFDNLKKGKKVLVNVKINTEQVSDDALWIYNSYGIDFRVGAKLKTTL